MSTATARSLRQLNQQCLARRYQFTANYTLARNRDDDSSERNFSRELELNPFDLSIEEGPSKQDVRHNLNLNGRVAGRNSMRQPYFFNLDLRLLKAFRFGETRRLDLSFEAFNVTRSGNKNLANDAISVYGTPLADGSPSVPNAGQPLFAPSTARFGGSRQVQLGLRFVF